MKKKLPAAVRRAGTTAHYRDAAYYDFIYRARRSDVRFYVQLAKTLQAKSVLELGAGSGRVAVEIARAGYPIVAVEPVAEMLRAARAKIAALPTAASAQIQLHRGDLRRLRLGRRFPLVIAPFNVFMHLYTASEFDAALQTVRRHLARGGLFAFDVRMPQVEELALDPTRLYPGRSFLHPTDGVRYKFRQRFAYDPVSQLQLITMVYESAHDVARSYVTPLLHRQFFPAELVELLDSNGFEVVHRWGDFARAPLTPTSESQLIVARPRRPRA
ncbi:MAG: class I SAM-dependent methyltransferase [Planctomycetota bacterium]